MDEFTGELRNEKESNEKLRKSVTSARIEMNEMDETLSSLTESVLSYHNMVEIKQTNVKLLTKQLEESNRRIANLENNLGMKGENNDGIHSSGEGKQLVEMNKIENQANVIILHDSLCDDINESIMSRERINTKKMQTHSLAEIELKLNEIQNADVIVIQSLTNSLPQQSSNEINKLINDSVYTALSKAKKVVVSTIIARDDEYIIHLKGELINSIIKYNYINEGRVVICNNDNLNDNKFRVEDGIHLTPHGTSLLAVNLKYKIAEALNIDVVKKPARSYERSSNRRNSDDTKNHRQKLSM